MKQQSCILLLLSFTACAIASTGDLAYGTQSYAVKGRLLCGAVPAAAIKVKLVDEDFGRCIMVVMDRMK
jgi:hypothetical protein